MNTVRMKEIGRLGSKSKCVRIELGSKRKRFRSNSRGNKRSLDCKNRSSSRRFCNSSSTNKRRIGCKSKRFRSNSRGNKRSLDCKNRSKTKTKTIIYKLSSSESLHL